MRDRVLLVGEDFGNSPAEYHTDAGALTGASGRFLAGLCDYQGPNAMLRYMLDFERTNVVELASDWMDRAKVAASVQGILQRMRGRRTILLGQRVANAFGSPDVPALFWTTLYDSLPNVGLEWADARIALVPHPSGRNRWWNDASHREEAKWFLKSAIA